MMKSIPKTNQVWAIKQCISLTGTKKTGYNTGAPKLINSDLFLEKRVFIGTVARFSRNKSLLISFGAPVVTTTCAKSH